MADGGRGALNYRNCKFIIHERLPGSKTCRGRGRSASQEVTSLSERKQEINSTCLEPPPPSSRGDHLIRGTRIGEAGFSECRRNSRPTTYSTAQQYTREPRSHKLLCFTNLWNSPNILQFTSFPFYLDVVSVTFHFCFLAFNLR